MTLELDYEKLMEQIPKPDRPILVVPTEMVKVAREMFPHVEVIDRNDTLLPLGHRVGDQ